MSDTIHLNTTMYTHYHMVGKKGSQKTMNLRCTPELINFLKDKATYGEALEDVIWRLINSKTLREEDKKGIPSAFESKINLNEKRTKR